MTRYWSASTLFGFLVLSGSAIAPQLPADADAGAPSVVQATPAVNADQAQPLSASRMPPPASTRTYVHVFLAFAIAFVLLGGYVTVIGRQLARLEDEIRRVSD